MKVVQSEPEVHVMEGPWSVDGVIRDVVAGGQQEDPFYVFNVGEVLERYQAWTKFMPDVKPFYAVKCNDDPLLLSVLASQGAGFDCASKAEIELVTSLGVTADRIIFANPAKMASHIRYAAAAGVDTMTFDSETELLKIKHLMPSAKLVVRIRCDAPDAQCPLGIKFGCDPLEDAPRLLKLAAVMQMDIWGVSFHVGSGAGGAEVYGRALRLSAALGRAGRALGHSMALVDIGGGFPGNSGSDLSAVSEVVNASLDQFPAGVKFIAEPGRYFAAAAYTLAAMVHAKREICSKTAEGEDQSQTMYFINDGVYGSFNCVLYDHQQVHAEPLEPSPLSPLPCSVWGPSCDGLDCVLPATHLPPLSAGAWLVFRDMGAYTLPVASAFNGFPVPRVRAVVAAENWCQLKASPPLGRCREVSPPRDPHYVEIALK